MNQLTGMSDEVAAEGRTRTITGMSSDEFGGYVHDVLESASDLANIIDLNWDNVPIVVQEATLAFTMMIIAGG